jgi:ABC-2 type transport system ATP-binding protein
VTGPVSAVEVDGLVKRYGRRAVVDDISLAVRGGEVCALLGPNGAGKSTTAEIIEGYRRPDAGSVRVLGANPWGAGPDHRARVGLMLQQGGIDPRMRPAETLRLYAGFFARPRDPDVMLDVAGLRGVAGIPYRRLSGGERQRLGLALACLGRPEVLVLDEPTAGMDPAAKATTRELLASMRDEGAAILLATHELADAERLADRIVIIVAGRVVAAGSQAELLSGATPHLRFRLPEPLAEDDRTSLGRSLAGTLVVEGPAAYRLDDAVPTAELVARLAAWCADRGITIVELRTTRATLEERYLDLVGRSHQ